ncbi:probable S-adenosyl-L-methionine-dependent RNA methyltransferase Rsm22p, mitochondrial [[Candida] jaroonii]|uniref:Probable S-adenosyl-L-methionine-dependent RNA methyltransferase Rsm22p, mitochondrial n=1 Tax=[Candida] jaroonii TaxID=467808 RepID=A0ACA9YBK0_9ASCO|nr:probable S-adenosyl-L-methionine-dependent RNA methyltransferase Rsm22p, mitochondrial [[Candida] jaroonii]
MFKQLRLDYSPKSALRTGWCYAKRFNSNINSFKFDFGAGDTTFGELVDKNSSDVSDYSPYRNADGSFIKGSSSEEARLHDDTIKGRVNHNVIALPDEISKVINNNILSLVSPDRLRTKSAEIYQSLSKGQMLQAPTNSIETDAHIASLFLQDYAHTFQVLDELKKRTDAKPDSILTVGYGPATGMVAANEVFEDFRPSVKHAYIVGRFNREMKKRAKIILSRQLCEQPLQVEEVEEDAVAEVEDNEVVEEFEEEFEESQEQVNDYVGPVDTSRINIVTKIKDSLPSRSYDLIVVNHALLTKEHHFPRDVDINIHMLLNLLNPKGHIVLIERGNHTGFEIISRARQLMIRPENYDKEIGKLPRPYIKGSKVKPQKLRGIDQLITEDDIEFEEQMLADIEKEIAEENEVSEMQQSDDLEDLDQSEDFEQSIIEKHGEVSEEDLKFEFEDDENFELTEVKEAEDVDVEYHLKIIAPCAHHSKCPLQMGDPKYYKIPSHKHKLSWCSFDNIVERPKYTMELKKGKRLATNWDKSADDGFGLDNLNKGTLRNLQGKGRPGGKNTENGQFSYLIAQRSSNSPEEIKKINYEREFNSSKLLENSEMNWPRIISIPTKIKNNVKLKTCAPSGNIEIWQIPKSMGKQIYHDARKVKQGDLWALDKKSVQVKNQLGDVKREKLDILSKLEKKSFIKQQRKKTWKKLVSHSEEDFDDVVKLSDSIATNLETSKQYKWKGKKAKYDVDPRKYDGK